jgi:hypothetical protein
MIPEKQAAAMSYLEYKAEFWRRLVNWWIAYRERHPDEVAKVDETLIRCRAQAAYWRDKLGRKPARKHPPPSALF